ncbi:hypothetical protein SAMN05444396_10981 [Flavobacterium segetis]|uniref:Uncharacterized protein n=1 Tax=Flavobacterium segetis TaxID=271157 RepID=A0A1M5J3H4_9FLAO|nr:hypothetical protein SAMN05444396_10981 [Flavobacterium segetis]
MLIFYLHFFLLFFHSISTFNLLSQQAEKSIVKSALEVAYRSINPTYTFDQLTYKVKTLFFLLGLPQPLVVIFVVYIIFIIVRCKMAYILFITD